MARTEQPSCEALYRAALTFCLDGADAMMVAMLKGAPNAQALWEELALARPSRPAEIARPALKRLDRMFVDGITRWGRHADATAMQIFRSALASWHQRMDLLPSDDIMGLADWFTVNGEQWIIAPDHPCWPHQLDDLSIRSDWAPPLCLWGLGDPQALIACDSPVGVVGSRDVNEYGRHVAHTIGEQAVIRGHTVVSGGAMGADAAAHWGALDAMTSADPLRAGRTVAVFAGGLNHMGPSRNRNLFERIEAQHGALISELCPGTIPEARRFLLRNRIIAALSSTLVVAQARLRSGALNTAGWACELMREVYAVPGDINMPQNAGCNKIIAQHQAAILCAATSIDDICHPPHHPIRPEHGGGSWQRPQASAQHQRSDPVTANTDTHPPTPKRKVDGNNQSHTIRQATVTGNPPMPDLRTSTDNTPNHHTERTLQLSVDQRRMLALINSCTNRGLPVTPDALLTLARNGENTGFNQISEVIQALGELELIGAISKDGTGGISAHCSAGVQESRP